MKKIIIAIVAIIILMFCEYRFIMRNIRPYYADNGFIFIEFMGQVDSYYAEPIFSNEK